MRIAMLAIGVVIGFLVLGALVLDEGEVVTLLTAEGGREYRTHLWIVEIDGREFVRANRLDSNWLARLKANPEVRLRRSVGPHAPSEPYWARPIDDLALSARVDTEIARKYRFADRVGRQLVDDRESVVVELTLRSESAKEKGAAAADPGAGP